MFFKTAVLRKLFDIRFSYKHCNFSRVCLLVKMVSKTVTRSIRRCMWWPRYMSYCMSSFRLALYWTVTPCLLFHQFRLYSSTTATLGREESGRYKKSFRSSREVYLTNRPQFPMVYTLVDHRNDVIKCSKLKWNHEPQASGFTARFFFFSETSLTTRKHNRNIKPFFRPRDLTLQIKTRIF